MGVMSMMIVNCLPLTDKEQQAFVTAAGNIEQHFVGDIRQRGTMVWRADVPADLRSHATAVIGNIPPSECADYPQLEWLQTWSAGVDKYVAPGVLNERAHITNASGAYGQTVSEHLFAMMWSLMKNLPMYARQQEDERWHDLGAALSPCGATVLVIGTGDIGSHFARLCKAVGAHTVGVRRNASKLADGIDEMHGFDELDGLLPQADVVALIVPAADDTYHLIDGRRLTLMKSTAILLNAGRGTAIDSRALDRALSEDQLHGVGLDVTEPEPLPAGDPLWQQPHCLITPHVAGGNHLAVTEQRIIDIALRNVAHYAAGEPLDNVRR